MHISLAWLKKFVPEFEIASTAEFKDALDTRLSEVESIVEYGQGLEKLVIAKVESFKEHPKHKNLKVCQVNIGQPDLIQIVCGADNVQLDMYSVAVLPGGKVYDQNHELMSISVREVAGVESNGMLCAPDELGISEDHNGIMQLDESVPAGTDVTELFQDIVIEIENKALPHRPDAFSHLGIAREVSAIFNTPLTTPEFDTPRVRSEEKIKIEVENQTPEFVKRYSGLAMANIQVGPSPLWLQLALARVGERPINNVVDITNYVMHHLGQPLHAFDASKLKGNKIITRFAKKGEKVKTLDGVERELTNEMLVIADSQNSIAVAGIMGGESTEIDNNTTRIFLESANFEMYNIRRTSRALGLRTQASSRYEKGITPATTVKALNQAAELIVSVCGGEVANNLIDTYPTPEEPKIIEFDLGKIKRYTGNAIDKKYIQQHLEALGFEIEGIERVTNSDIQRNTSGLMVNIKVPEWRRDINIAADLIEEISRLYGYEKVSPTLPTRDLQTPDSNYLLTQIDAAKRVLSQAGLFELYTYSMVGDELYKKAMLDSSNLITIMDAISPELAKVRDSLLPSLLEKVAFNLTRYSEFGVFEISRIALPPKKPAKNELPKQPYLLAGVYVGDEMEDVYRKLKYAFDSLNRQQFNNRLEVAAGDNRPVFHPGRSGIIGIDGVQVGEIGMIHPQALQNMGIKTQQVAAFNIDITTLLKHITENPSERVVHNPSNYPLVQRDISFWQKSHTFLGDVITEIKNTMEEDLFELKIVDIFDQKPANKQDEVQVEKDRNRSITLRLKLVSDHTLESEEINKLMSKAVKAISSKGHEIR